MAKPYDLFIRYLASRGVEDLGAANAELLKFNLRPIVQEDLDKPWDAILEAMPKGVVEQMRRKIYGSDFPRYLEILELKDVWEAFENKTSRRAFEDIHEDPVLRLTLNALLAKGLKIEEIARLLNAKFSIAVKETHLDLYKRIFFDPRRMRRADWKRYLASGSGREKHLIFMALTENADALKTELDLPAQISVSDTLQWLITKSFARAKQCMSAGTPETGQEARAWIDKIIQLSDKYEKYRSADQQDFAKTLQLEFDFIDDEFESPDGEMLVDAETASKKAAEGQQSK